MVNQIDSSSLTEAKLKAGIDNAVSLREHRNRALSEGMKGLLLLNGGGAVALLAFLQAIWNNTQGEHLKYYMVAALWVLLFGALCAAVIGFTRYHGAFHKHTFTPEKNPWWRAQVTLTIVSCLCFAVGSVLAGLGVLDSIP